MCAVVDDAPLDYGGGVGCHILRSISKSALQLFMLELVGCPDLSEDSSFLVGISEEGHQAPGQAAVDGEPAAGEDKLRVFRLEESDSESDRNAVGQPDSEA
jgi:hypothetical protein